MAQVDTTVAVDVQHTTTAYQRQHKSHFDRPATIPIHKHKEKARHRGRLVVRSRAL
jgi:hypothetical protein